MNNEPEIDLTSVPTYIALLVIQRDGYMQMFEAIQERIKGTSDLTLDQIEFWEKQCEFMVDMMRSNIEAIKVATAHKLQEIAAKQKEVEAKAKTAHLN